MLRIRRVNLSEIIFIILDLNFFFIFNLMPHQTGLEIKRRRRKVTFDPTTFRHLEWNDMYGCRKKQEKESELKRNRR